MNAESKAPNSFQVVAAIARREIVMAMRRRLVRMLFLLNLIPPIVMAVILIVYMFGEEFGLRNLDWDPLVRFLQVQGGPVVLLALGIGTPLVARDRSEDVLFLYATRPVTPWSYTLGKMAAVAVPSAALLLIPAILIAILRVGLMTDFGVVDALVLVGKIVVVALLMSWAYSGVTVGPSAATRKARWALLLAIACFVIPAIVSDIIWDGGGYALDASTASDDLIASLFGEEYARYGLVGAGVLLLWGALGALVTSARVRREMIP